MSENEAERLLGRLSYKPGHHFTLLPRSSGHALSILQEKQDSTSPGHKRILLAWCGKPMALESMDEESFLAAVREEVLLLEEHEAHEWLRFDGRLLYNPHDECGDGKAELALGGKLFVPWKHRDVREPKSAIPR